MDTIIEKQTVPIKRFFCRANNAISNVVETAVDISESFAHNDYIHISIQHSSQVKAKRNNNPNTRSIKISMVLHNGSNYCKCIRQGYIVTVAS